MSDNLLSYIQHITNISLRIEKYECNEIASFLLKGRGRNSNDESMHLKIDKRDKILRQLISFDSGHLIHNSLLYLKVLTKQLDYFLLPSFIMDFRIHLDVLFSVGAWQLVS